MCGRFVRTSPQEAIRAAFAAAGGSDLALSPRFNVCPGEDVVAVAQHGTERRIGWLRWGLVPSFATSSREGPRAINARSETVGEGPAFRAAVRHRRCLVVADGFYEWRRTGGRTTPFFFRLRAPGPFAFAGVWERWTPPEGAPLVSCAILTTAANATVAPIHDRMPVILPPASYARWFDPTVTDPRALADLFMPFPAAEMVSHPVRPLVNSPRNDGPDCIEPA